MNRMIIEATVKRYNYDNHGQLRKHFADFIATYNFGRRLKSLNGLSPTKRSAIPGKKSRTALRQIRPIKSGPCT